MDIIIPLSIAVVTLVAAVAVCKLYGRRQRQISNPKLLITETEIDLELTDPILETICDVMANRAHGQPPPNE